MIDDLLRLVLIILGAIAFFCYGATAVMFKLWEGVSGSAAVAAERQPTMITCTILALVGLAFVIGALVIK